MHVLLKMERMSCERPVILSSVPRRLLRTLCFHLLRNRSKRSKEPPKSAIEISSGMGIQNLLRFLKPFIKPVHIKEYAGKWVGIDAYSWLHKGAYSCSMELCLKLQTDTAKRYLKYFMHHINLLRHYNITPVVVFDGGNMPCKAATEEDRHRRRESSLEMAKEQLKQGNATAAVELFQRAVRITPTMAHQLIQLLHMKPMHSWHTCPPSMLMKVALQL